LVGIVDAPIVGVGWSKTIESRVATWGGSVGS
jgi:hypothetical protein